MDRISRIGCDVSMDEQMTFAELESWAADQLQRAELPVAAHEIRLLLMAATGLDRASLMVVGDQTCPPEAVETFTGFLHRRIQREPVFRILGHREFHSMEFELNQFTLEPRDDTECLIELSLAQISDRQAGLDLLDLGTGTGIVALSLLRELANAKAVAVDVEPGALQMAQSNAEKNGLADRFTTLESNWFERVNGTFDLIVSNPPYITSGDMELLAPEVRRFDPSLALDGGQDGLDAYRIILRDARNFLRPKGSLLLEIGYDQRQQLVDLAAATGWQVVQAAQDLSGNDRAICLR